MTGNEAIEILLARIGAAYDGATFFSAQELRDWPRAAVLTFKKAGLLTLAGPARSVTCNGCEQQCQMPVEIVSRAGRSAAFVVCDKRPDINRVDVPLERLERWQASGEAVAAFLATTLGINRSPGVAKQGKGWSVGMLRGKHAAHVVLTNVDLLTLELAGHAVPLVEVLSLKGGRLEVQRQVLIDCVDRPAAGGGTRESAAARGKRLEKWAEEIGQKAAAAKEEISVSRLKQILAASRKRSVMLFVFALISMLPTISAPMAQAVTDGDTIRLDGVTWRLWGIDAPESKQLCGDWPAGVQATATLGHLIGGKKVICEARTVDRYGRTVGLCRANGADIGAAMVQLGMAWAFVRYSADYVKIEAQARRENLGVHAHGCQPAWEWRRVQSNGLPATSK